MGKIKKPSEIINDYIGVFTGANHIFLTISRAIKEAYINRYTKITNSFPTFDKVYFERIVNQKSNFINEILSELDLRLNTQRIRLLPGDMRVYLFRNESVSKSYYNKYPKNKKLSIEIIESNLAGNILSQFDSYEKILSDFENKIYIPNPRKFQKEVYYDDHIKLLKEFRKNWPEYELQKTINSIWNDKTYDYSNVSKTTRGIFSIMNSFDNDYQAIINNSLIRKVYFPG